MKTTAPPIRNPESIDFPSSYRKKSQQHRTVHVFTVLILVFSVFSTLGVFFNIVSVADNNTASGNGVGRLETRNVVRPTPTYSVQELNLARKTLLESRLREQGMLVGECGMFRCSKRWNEYMDAEIIRLIGR